MRPFDAGKMTAWKVRKDVGNVQNDTPDLIEPASASKPAENHYPETPGPLFDS
ncbi:MAG TPA: hypothetical protein VHZ55_03825 [Bryobacteraceae bacterium]|nr:hypothetical protein [Bryobacteraceae bacterium]